MSQLKYIIPAIALLFFSVAILLNGNSAGDGFPYFSKEDPLAADYARIVNEGKALFNDQCRVCHSLYKTCVISLPEIMQNEHWTSTGKIASFLRSPESYAEDKYVSALMEGFGMKTHKAFPRISDEEVTAIVFYLMSESKRRF